MATPTSVVRGDLAVSVEQFDLEAAEMGFIASQVLPFYDVPVVAGQYAVIPASELLKPRDDSRAPGGSYTRQNSKFQMATYSCIEHGTEEVVDDREAQMYARYFDAEQVAAKRARRTILSNFEQRVQAKVQNTTTFSTGNGNSTSLTTMWSNESGATPCEDIDAGKITVRNNCGMLPNTLLLTLPLFLNVRKTAEVVDRIKYSGIDDPKDITTKMLGSLFGLKRVVVAGAVYNSANQGQNVTFTSTWTDSQPMLAYISDSPDIREVTLGRTFHWGKDGSGRGESVESYRDETVRGTVVRCRMDSDEEVMYAAAGLLFTGAM